VTCLETALHSASRMPGGQLSLTLGSDIMRHSLMALCTCAGRQTDPASASCVLDCMSCHCMPSTCSAAQQVAHILILLAGPFHIRGILKVDTWKYEHWWQEITNGIYCAANSNKCATFSRRNLTDLFFTAFCNDLSRTV